MPALSWFREECWSLLLFFPHTDTQLDRQHGEQQQHQDEREEIAAKLGILHLDQRRMPEPADEEAEQHANRGIALQRDMTVVLIELISRQH